MQFFFRKNCIPPCVGNSWHTVVLQHNSTHVRVLQLPSSQGYWLLAAVSSMRVFIVYSVYSTHTVTAESLLLNNGLQMGSLYQTLQELITCDLSPYTAIIFLSPPLKWPISILFWKEICRHHFPCMCFLHIYCEEVTKIHHQISISLQYNCPLSLEGEYEWTHICSGKCKIMLCTCQFTVSAIP